jgi:hypothetical protein
MRHRIQNYNYQSIVLEPSVVVQQTQEELHNLLKHDTFVSTTGGGPDKLPQIS